MTEALPHAAPAWRRIVSQARMELLLALRNGESLLATFGIPLGLLVFFGLVPVLPTDDDPVAFLVPGVLALSVISASMVSLGIATGFERFYLVLKRLGVTPLRRGELVAAKVGAVVVLETVQVLVVLAVATLLLGWEPSSVTRLWLLPVGIALGTATFAGLGLALAGRLRAIAALAVINALYVALLLVGGVVIPLDRLPGPLAAVAAVLPAAPLVAVFRGAVGEGGGVGTGSALLTLGLWAVVLVALAAASFRWD